MSTLNQKLNRLMSRSPIINLVGVKKSGSALYACPKNLRYYELCLIAVKSNGWVLTEVPMEYRTLEIVSTAYSSFNVSYSDPIVVMSEE